VILVALPNRDFDPTEVSIPWRALTRAGHEVRFATPDGEPAAADTRVLSGRGFGPLRFLLAASDEAVRTYEALERDSAFRRPLRYEDVRLGSLDGLLLPGGHAPGMRPYLESKALQALVAEAFAVDLPIGAICHGVLVLARALAKDDERSVLHGRTTTALPRRMELPAWLATAPWLGRYLRTYDVSVETEVRRALASPHDFRRGPLLPRRDRADSPARGFAVVDGNYVSARWPGDAHRFADALLGVLAGRRAPSS
jgi:protease I